LNHDDTTGTTAGFVPQASSALNNPVFVSVISIIPIFVVLVVSVVVKFPLFCPHYVA
jgi:hypothetical protein